MRFSTIVSAAATAAPMLASAAGTMGFALGNKRADASCKTANDYELDFKALKTETDARIVRIYAASDCDVSKIMLPIAKKHGFQVVLGIWYVVLFFPSSSAENLAPICPSRLYKDK
jgi:glucan 1,3-beta-glucosidase